MNSNPRPTSMPKPVCPNCEQPLSWLTRQIRGRFCSAECKAKYQEMITKFAMERLKAAIPKRIEQTAPQGRRSIVLTPGPEGSAS